MGRDQVNGEVKKSVHLFRTKALRTDTQNISVERIQIPALNLGKEN